MCIRFPLSSVLFESKYKTAATVSKDTEPLFLQINQCRESQSEGYILQSVISES